MFNFFDELKTSLSQDLTSNYQLVNISGQLLYVEGHLGITQLSKKLITFKIKGGHLTIEGEDLILSELTSNTLKICGKICKIEAI